MIYATDIIDLGFEGMEVIIHTPKGMFKAKINIPGKHNIYNALVATAVGLEMKLTLEEIQKGINEAKTISGRANLLNINGMLVMDDCYNANPASVKSAIDVLSHAKGRTIAVLGDMGELGENEREMHFDVGKFIGEKQIHTLFCTGALSMQYKNGVEAVGSNCSVTYFENRDEMIESLLLYIQEGDSILVKASHFMGFEKVIECLLSSDK